MWSVFMPFVFSVLNVTKPKVARTPKNFILPEVRLQPCILTQNKMAHIHHI